MSLRFIYTGHFGGADKHSSHYSSRIVLLLLLAASVFFCSVVRVSAQNNSDVADILSTEERAYLEQLVPITVAPDPDWLPFEFVDEQGNFFGIAADLLYLIEKRLDIEFKYVTPQDWSEALALSRAGDVLILPFLNQTPAREEWLVFTEPLLVDPNVFVTREDHLYIHDASQLANEKLVLPGGTSIEERILRDYPNLEIITVASESDVFKSVADGRADMTLRSLAVAAYTLRKEGLFDLKIAGQAPEHYTNYLRMGVRADEPMLRDILNKGIQTISLAEREEILNRHINITYITSMDRGFILRIAGALFLLIAASYYWNYRLKKANAALAESERSKSVLLSNLPGLAYRCRYDADWTMEFISQGCVGLTGYLPEDLLYNRVISFNDLMNEKDRQMAREIWVQAEDSRQPVRLEYRITCADEKEKWVFEQGVFVYDGNGQIEAIEGLIIDVTDRKRAEEELHRISINDELTGLYNRRFILQQLERVCSEYRRTRQNFAVVMLDLDHFKLTNDIYGHQAGDYVLKEFSHILLTGLRPYDLVGRFGGEEFIMVIMNIELPLVKTMMLRLREELNQHAFEFQDSCLKVSFSAGITMADEARTECCPDSLIKIADDRLYLAKKQGRDQTVCAEL